MHLLPQDEEIKKNYYNFKQNSGKLQKYFSYFWLRNS